jgi:hypothetical protein
MLLDRRRHFLMMAGAPGSLAPTPPRGPAVDVFLMLMVGAPVSPAPTPPRGPAIDIF